MQVSETTCFITVPSTLTRDLLSSCSRNRHPNTTYSLIRRDGNRQPYNRLSVLHTHSYICLVSFSRTSDFQDSGKFRYSY